MLGFDDFFFFCILVFDLDSARRLGRVEGVERVEAEVKGEGER